MEILDNNKETGLMSLKDATTMARKEIIEKALKHFRGNRTQAAKILGVQRTYLSKLIKNSAEDPS